MTIKELLDYCIDTNHSLTAHLCYWAMTARAVRPTDDIAVLDTLDYDSRAICELMARNLLGLGQVKLFVVQVDASHYAFYFGHNGLEVASLHQRLFGAYLKIVEAPRLLDRLMYIVEQDESVFLWAYRKQVVELPAYIGHARAGEQVLWRY